jgi:hypothetical protein
MAVVKHQCTLPANLWRTRSVLPLASALMLVTSRAGALPPNTAQGRAEISIPGLQCPTCDELSTLGIRGTETLSVVAERSRADAAVLLGFYNHAYKAYALASSRTLEFGSIGGGSAGFEGSLGADWAGGIRIPFGDNHGPVARVGLRAFMGGNDNIYVSRLDLPIGHLGYQLLTKYTLLEVAASAAPVLAGRYSLDGAQKRKLGEGFAWGGHVGLRLQHMHLEVQFSRIEPESEARLSHIDELWGTLCGVVSMIAICTDIRYWSGDVRTRSPQRETANGSAYYLGLHIAGATRAQRSRKD